MKSTNIRIEDVAYSFEDYRYRTPIKFGGVALDRVTLANVEITVRTLAGKRARGIVVVLQHQMDVAVGIDGAADFGSHLVKPILLGDGMDGIEP